jgi:hypothetical protein
LKFFSGSVFSFFFFVFEDFFRFRFLFFEVFFPFPAIPFPRFRTCLIYAAARETKQEKKLALLYNTFRTGSFVDFE